MQGGVTLIKDSAEAGLSYPPHYLTVFVSDRQFSVLDLEHPAGLFQHQQQLCCLEINSHRVRRGRRGRGGWRLEREGWKQRGRKVIWMYLNSSSTERLTKLPTHGMQPHWFYYAINFVCQCFHTPLPVCLIPVRSSPPSSLSTPSAPSSIHAILSYSLFSFIYIFSLSIKVIYLLCYISTVAN